MIEERSSRSTSGCIDCSIVSAVLGVTIGGLATGAATAAVQVVKHNATSAGIWTIKEVASFAGLTFAGVVVGAIVGGIVTERISEGCRGFSPGTLAELFVECLSGRNSHRNRSCDCSCDCPDIDFD